MAGRWWPVRRMPAPAPSSARPGRAPGAGRHRAGARGCPAPAPLRSGLRRAYRMRALAAAGRFDRASLGRETLALYEAAIAAARRG